MGFFEDCIFFHPRPTRPDPARPGPTRPDPARPGPARPDPTRHNPTRPDSVRWDIRCAAHLPPQLEHRLYYNARGFLWPPARPPARSHRRPPTFYIFKTPNGVMCPSSIFNVRCDARSTCPKVIQIGPKCPSSTFNVQCHARGTCPEVIQRGTMCPSSIFNVRCDARSACPKVIQSGPTCPSSILTCTAMPEARARSSKSGLGTCRHWRTQPSTT